MSRKSSLFSAQIATKLPAPVDEKDAPVGSAYAIINSRLPSAYGRFETPGSFRWRRAAGTVGKHARRGGQIVHWPVRSPSCSSAEVNLILR